MPENTPYNSETLLVGYERYTLHVTGICDFAIIINVSAIKVKLLESSNVADFF